MRYILLSSAIALSLSTTAAFAAEGNGDPFPFRAPGVTTTVTGTKLLADQPDNPFGYKAPGQVVTSQQSGAMMPSVGSEGAVQSANSLPAGFGDNTSQFAQRRPASPAATAQRAHSSTHG